MTQHVMRQFFNATKIYLDKLQPKAASLGSPPELTRPEGSRLHSLSGSLPPLMQ